MSYFPVAHTMRYDIAKEVDLSNSDLTEEQKNRLHNVIRLHSKAFVGFDGQVIITASFTTASTDWRMSQLRKY